MRYVIFLLCMLMTQLSFAEVPENKVYLRDGKIIIENEEGHRLLDYSKKGEIYSTIRSNQWNVKEQVNPVEEALKVFKDKDKSIYHKKIWIYNNRSGQESVAVEFLTDDQYQNVVFSPEEDYAYYLGLSDSGIKNVYGLGLLKQNKFILGSGADFDITTCNDNTSYIVVQKEVNGVEYIIYDMAGQQVDFFEKSDDFPELNEVICR